VNLSHVYVIEKESGTKQLQRIACADEDKELQRLLECNLNLLPGDQISPGQNLRWLLVKREMPVVNPSTGENLWSIDFLLADQDGVPTLVECKRHNDTRSRREVVGQMLEYAASGRHYWTASDFRSHAQNTAGDEAKLKQRLIELTGAEIIAEEFFAVMEQNLQRSRMRLIFFLDDSPFQLRSIVEFLNGQSKDMEVLIVEARQYQHEGARILVPWVFGFTEEARVAKRDYILEAARSSLAKGEAAFWEAIETTALSPEWKQAIHRFLTRVADAPGCELRWLKTCLIDLPDVVPQKTLLSINRDGSLQLYLASWKPKDSGPLTTPQSTVRQDFFNEVQAMFGYSLADLESKQFPILVPERWIPTAARLAELVERLGASYTPQAETIEK
jgi:hypothetical protein